MALQARVDDVQQLLWSGTSASSGARLRRQVREDGNTIRLHASIGYVTSDEDKGRGGAIRQARHDGRAAAHLNCIAHRRNTA